MTTPSTSAQGPDARRIADLLDENAECYSENAMDRAFLGNSEELAALVVEYLALTASPSPAALPASPSGVREVLRGLIDRVHDFGTFAIDADDPVLAWENSVVPALVAARASLASAATPAATSGSEDGKPGAGMSEMAEIARVVSEWRHGPMLSAEALRQIAALSSSAAPAVEPSGVLDLYREAVRIDVKMEGPQFMGCNASALKRAWEADRAAPYAHPAPATGEMDFNELARRMQRLGAPGTEEELEAALRAALAPATEGRKS